MSEIKNIKSKDSWNKNDLTILLASEAGIPKVHAAKYINIVTDTIAEALEDGKKVTISDFGTFQVSERSSFDGRNPKTNEPLRVPMRRIPVFKAGKKLKRSLNFPQVKTCRLVDINKVKLVFSKVMEPSSELFDSTAYEVLIDRSSVGPILNIEVSSVGVEILLLLINAVPLISPLTSNGFPGSVKPMPTLPFDFIRIRSEPFTPKCK